MSNNQNLEKRIKRHIIGKTRFFFAATLPGIEHLCFNELISSFISDANAAVEHGGVLFSGRVHDCYRANLTLRTANRILMRLASFKASNFRQLETKLSEIPWELYLKYNMACEIHATSKHSRLIHTDAIAERFIVNIKQRLEKSADTYPASGPGRPQTIFVRAENNHFNVSLDSSGDLLHKRGLKVKGGKAPVRETVAAAILTLAGYQPGEILIDPMCGSGTFSLEAAMMTKNIPAGWYREFAFMDWPCFRPTRWEHIRREAEKGITTHNEESLIFASDTDAETVEKFFQLVKLQQLSSTIHVAEANFFDLQPDTMRGLPVKRDTPGLIVLNPPYGRRLGTKRSVEKMIGEIVKKLTTDFKGWKTAILLPEKHLLTKIPFKTKTYNFLHGGLPITLVTGIIP